MKEPDGDDDRRELINSKGALLSNILKDLNSCDAFICFGVTFKSDGDSLAAARYGDKTEVMAAMGYLLAEDEWYEVREEVIKISDHLREKNGPT
jgi:hypothetical protein